MTAPITVSDLSTRPLSLTTERAIREFVPDRRLVMSWTVEGPGGAADSVETLVTVEFRETGSGGTEMGFREEYTTEEYAVDPDAKTAWTAAFDGLEALFGAPAKGG